MSEPLPFPQSSAALSLSGISKTFGARPGPISKLLGRKAVSVSAVSDVSFDVRPGETFAVVGESGCGKSTLARMIVGLLKPSNGTVQYRGRPLAAGVDERDRPDRRHLQMVFQDPYSSLNPRWTVGRLLAEPLLEHGLTKGRDATGARVGELLGTVGLSPSDAGRYPHQFSGGQRQRICIARALACEPDFIVWDEPTSALDVSVQAQILNLIRRLQRERSLTFVFISHNLGVVQNIADRVAVMYLGRIVELGPTDAVLNNPRHPYTRMLIDAVPRISKPRRSAPSVRGEVPNPLNPPTGCAFHPRCGFAQADCRTARPALQEDRDQRQIACLRSKQLPQ
ncbi:MAG: ATP-binding cassette domain-containing protein [Alphaproteobacteria bacterium]